MIAITKAASRLLEVAGVGEGARRRFAMAAIGTFILKVVAKAIGFVTTVVLARLLGADGLGTYFFSLSVTRVIGVIGLPGVWGLVIQRVAAYRGSGDWSLIKGLLQRSC